MNNQQFRKLVLDTPARQALNDGQAPVLGATPRRGDMTLGSRKRSAIPMTPRSLAVGGGNDFARQLAERQRETSGQSTKKFKSSAAPKGSKLASGYVDRAKQREEEEEDDKATRIKNLEEMMKLQQIDRVTFERLRDDIIGGDINSVHLVKGLDFKLLERVRRGEDVLSSSTKEVEEDREEGPAADVDDEFEALEDKEIKPVEKGKVEKHGVMAPPTLIPGKKRNRDQILAELKAAREAAKAKAGPTLGAKFKKVGAPRETSRIERDAKGREVLITVDEHGNEKRKVRKLQEEPAVAAEKGHGLLMPDKDAAPLGMDVVLPEQPKLAAEDDDDFDIFDDAGDDYDPLADLAEDSESEEEKENGEVPDSSREQTPQEKKESKDKFDMPPPPRPATSVAAKPRNYFGDKKEEDGVEKRTPAAMSDPHFLAALKKASQIAAHAKVAKSEEEAAREAKLKRMLENQDRDAADMDMGFGSSRLADEEDLEDDDKMKLAKWGEEGDDEDGEGKKGGKKDRKRGAKKRKGDKNSADDVLRVMEARKAESGK